METILRWLAGLLAGILERYSDPDLDARLAKIKTDTAEVEKKEREAAQLAKESEAAYLAEDAKRKEWDRLTLELVAQNQESEARFNAAQERINARDPETAKLNQTVLDRSDDDAFGGGVPKPKNH